MRSLFVCIISGFAITACTILPEGQPLPEYPELINESAYAKDNPIEVYCEIFTPAHGKDADAEVYADILDQLKLHGYRNIRSGAHFEPKPNGEACIIDVVSCMTQDVKVNGLAVKEAHVLVALRKPGAFRGSAFTQTKSRYFQAYAQIPLANSNSDEEVQSQSIYVAVENLFRVHAFRLALEGK